jgi:endonuclease/exonuclease/phosphatase family metal-dependent hydrolase
VAAAGDYTGAIMSETPQNRSPRSTVRAVTLNLWGESPPFPRRLELVIEELGRLAPDIVALQEVRQVPGSVPNTAATIADALGLGHVFVRTVEWGGGDEGLALLSRFPLRESGHSRLPHPLPADERVALWGLYELPDLRDAEGQPATVLAATTHLTYRMTHGIQREDQAAAVDQTLIDVLARQPQRPAVTLLMGDFNAAPDADELRFLRGLHTVQGRRTYYQDAWLVQPQPPTVAGHTWARRNPYTHKLRFLEADRRIDYIFVGPAARDGRGLVKECRVVLDAADGSGVFPSDHFGLLAEVQCVPG